MAEESFEQLLNESMKSVRPGDIVTGKVVTVSPSEAVLNIGYKYDAFLSAREFDGKDEDLTQQLNAGDEVEVKVLKIDNKDSMITVSKRRVAAEKASEQLQKAFEDKTVLKGVAEAVKGGLTVEVEGSRVFIPGSLVSDTFVKDLSEFNGQEIEFVITEFDPRKHRIIGDRKQIVTQQHEADKAKLLEDLKVGDIIEGTVRSITTFGAFVDLGGADGLLHVTQMGWGRVGNPKELYHRGDKVRVFVQDIKGDRISLSTKFPDEDPWNSVESNYSLGQKVTGKVARMTDFGAFVALDDNIDGLLHVSQISNERIEKPSDVLSVGQEVTVMVTAIDVEKHRISLSMKDLEEAPAAVAGEDAE